MTPPPDSPDLQALLVCLEAVAATIDDLIEGRAAHPVPADACPPSARPLVHSVDRLMTYLVEIADFVRPLARGDLGAALPSPDNLMATPLVEMHRRLSRLTAQTQAIAHGDYSQRSDFMGEFSEAFNSMVELLEARELNLKAEIERRHQAEADLHRERDLLVAGPVVTFRWDVDDAGTVQYVSPNIAEYGYTTEEFMSGRRTYDSIIDPADYEWVVTDGNDKARTGLDAWNQEYRVVDGAGDTRWIRDYTHAVRGPDGEVTAYEGYIIDITMQKQSEAALRRREAELRMLSLADDLTGLYNRRGLFALGEHAMRSAHRRGLGLGVIYLDVDGLKRINDRFGHHQGDQALRAVADILRECIRESDVLARTGGDEFVVLAEDGPADTVDLTRRLERRITTFNARGEEPFRLSVSIGTVQWDARERVTLQELIERADQRMYDVKRSKRTA